MTGKPALCLLLVDAPAFSSEAAPVGFTLHCLGLTLSSQLFPEPGVLFISLPGLEEL